MDMTWGVAVVPEVDEWFINLDPKTTDQVTAAITLLKLVGPALGRPRVDRIEGSAVHNMKELRPGSAGASKVRILFVFDPHSQAVLLVADDKSGQWQEWYKINIPIAEERYRRWLAGEYSEGR